MLRLAVVDQADLRGRAAHVERHDLIEAALAREPSRQDGAAGRPGLDQPDGKTAPGRERREASARRHEQQRTGKATRLQGLVKPAEIAVHHRLHVGIGDCGRPALVLANLRRHLARQREGEPGQQAGENIASAPLVCAVAIGVHEPDGDRLDASALKFLRKRPHGRLIERDEHVAARIEPLGQTEAQVTRHQRRRLVHEDVVLLEAVLERHLDRVTKSLCHHERGLGALALDDGVGGERRAMDDQRDVGRRERRLRQHLADAGEHALLRSARHRKHLDAVARRPDFQCQIRKRAADVDGEACFAHIPYAAVCSPASLGSSVNSGRMLPPR